MLFFSFWKRFFETLHNCLNKCLPQISKTELLKAVYSLGILGYLPHRALDELLQKNSNDELTLSGQTLLCHVLVLNRMSACVCNLL